MQTFRKIILVLVTLVFFACQTKQDGVLEGTVLPPNIGAKITAMQAGKTPRSGYCINREAMIWLKQQMVAL